MQLWAPRVLEQDSSGARPSAVQRIAPIVEHVPMPRDTWRMRLACPEIAAQIVPGEFFMVRLPGETGAPAGLGPSLASWAAWDMPQDRALPRLWAVVNLGDEDTRLVLIDIPIRILAKLIVPHSDIPPPGTIGDRVKWFLREFPDSPAIRLRLGPGEGFCLPAGGLILDGDATDKQEPDVLLLISEQPCLTC